MSKVLRAAAVAVASTLAVPLWAVPAHAELAKESASVGAYFFRGGLSTEGTGLPDPPAKPPNVTGDRADGVAKGNLAVAAQGGQEDKVSFLRFDLAAAPFDATIGSAVLSVPLVPNSPPDNVVYNAAPERVRVCKSGDSGFFGQDGETIVAAPARLCEEYSSEPGTLSADGKAYEFDIAPLASMWLVANDGLALTVAEGAASSPFQVVFAPAEQATLSYSFTAAPDDVFVTPPLPPTTFDSGPTFDSGFTTPDTSFDGGTTFDAPLVDTALPAPAPEAQAAPEPAVAAPVRNVVTEASLTPSAGFWAALLALVGIAALLSLIMGDPRVATPAAAARPSRLSRALQSRQTSSLSGPRLARPLSI